MRSEHLASGADRSAAGFTLMEVMMVVSIIGLLAVIAIPGFRKARMRAQDSAFVNDLRVLSDAVFQQFAIASGGYPPDAAAGILPPDVAAYVPRHMDWSRPTSIGGQWDWDRAPARGETVRGAYAGISVIHPLRTSAQMAEIDAQIDDGNLNTGTFRAHPDGYIHILE